MIPVLGLCAALRVVCRHTRLGFAFVYPDRRGVNVMKVVGEVFASPDRRGPDDDKQLHQLQFQTGDFLDVAIYA